MPLIRTEKLQKTFFIGDLKVRAVKDLDLTIDNGDFVTIMGPSGSGKSSLMNILGCLDKPTGGKYFFNNNDISSLNRDELAVIRNKYLGFIFQSYNLLSRIPVIDNVILPLLYNEKRTPRAEAVEKAAAALEIVGLKERMNFKITQLSGGQQQRVTIARALINNPPLILADEPTGALDTKTSYEVMGIMQRLNDEMGITILMVTHNPEISLFSKRIINFRDGVILDDSKVENRLDAKAVLEQNYPATKSEESSPDDN